MQPLRIYDYLVRARERIFKQVRTLTTEQYARKFPIGLGSLDQTLTHIMSSEWYYVQRMTGRHVPPYEQWPIRPENPPPFAELEIAWSKQADETRAALQSTRQNWNEALEYDVTDDSGREKIVSASPADQFTQLILHEAHHRAQVMNMLRQLGFAAEDLDFNAMMFKRRYAK